MSDLRGSELAMVFQDPMSSLNPVVPIGTQVTEVLLRHQDVTRAQARDEAEDLLRRCGIPDPRRRLREYPHQLSGGMRQRALIAIALACKPALLICDEPTTALDVTIQAQVLELLKELVNDLGTAMVMITHDLGVVAGLCDFVNVMYAGRIVESAHRRDLFDHPRHRYTEGLLTRSRGWTPRGGRRCSPSPVRRGTLSPGPRRVRSRPDARMRTMPASAVTWSWRRWAAATTAYAACTRRRRTRRRPSTSTCPASTSPRTRTPRRGGRRPAMSDPLLQRPGLQVHFPIKRGIVIDRTVGHVPRGRRGRPGGRARADVRVWWGSPAAASRPSAGPSCGWRSRPAGR